MDETRRDWGLILAGGEGARLRPFTRQVAGDERPKQFCPLLGGETLLEQTRRRAALTIAPERTLVVLTRDHERYYAPLLEELPAHCAVVQPESRGTAPAILYGLLRVAHWAPTGAVAVIPSDHWVSDDHAFMGHVEAALEAVEARLGLVILLGIAADRPETEYGWIEAGDPIPVRRGEPLFRVRRFWEKPSPEVARALWIRGMLWNSFVMVARVPALLALLAAALPRLVAAFAPARPALDTLRETEAIRKVYAPLPSTSFSDRVLASRPANLAVLPVSRVEWSDLGDPRRLLDTLGRVRGSGAPFDVPSPVG
jgi:mannose-1-phosphate guanylyltransferase